MTTICPICNIQVFYDHYRRTHERAEVSDMLVIALEKLDKIKAIIALEKLDKIKAIVKEPDF